MMTRLELAKLFTGVGVEVGTAGGHFAQEIAKYAEQLYCVDLWETYADNRRGGGQKQHDDNCDRCVKLLKPLGVKLWKMSSMDASSLFDDESLDFVYIDGNHDFNYVMEDLINWTKKVKKGGIVAGHDMYHFNNSGVIEAVTAYTQANKYELVITPRTDDERRDNQHPNFYFYV